MRHVVDPAVGWYVPLGHALHVPEPVPLAKVLGGQSCEQAQWSKASVIWLSAQGKRRMGAGCEHTLQAVALLLPGTALYLPTGQPRHTLASDAPAVGLYVPAGHAVKVCRRLAAPTFPQ